MADPGSYNQKIWDQIAKAGDKYYVALDDDKVESARNGPLNIRLTPTKSVPQDWLGSLASKNVLCLACGGGQQAPLFAAAGADVTVFDISNEQLERDSAAAAKHNLQITTVWGDMANMAIFADGHFDLVVNPCSVCFCPELAPIWKEVYRVVATGGRFMTGFVKPIQYIFDQILLNDGDFKVVNKIPYSDLDLDPQQREQILGSERPLEFGHSLTSLIGGQIEAGFQVVGFYEDRWGDDDVLSDHIDVFAATLAIKP